MFFHRPALFPGWIVVSLLCGLLVAGCKPSVMKKGDACHVNEAAPRTKAVFRPAPELAPWLVHRPLLTAHANVDNFRLTVSPDVVRPCSTVKLRRDLVLRRATDPTLFFHETREFYAEGGELIAQTTDDLTSALTSTGSYRAITPLPIPQAAPPGRYRIVSRIQFRQKPDGKVVTLAQAENFFTIRTR